MRTIRRQSGLFRGAVSVMLSVLIPFTTIPGVALALPHGGHVTKGQATLSYSTNKLLVSQSTSQASFFWTGFNVGSAQSVTYKTPGASSVSMNFIGGTTPAIISGKVTSNGVLYFMAANGLVFDSGSTVSASGVRAYGSGTPGGSPTGSVTNAGTISVTPGGTVALVGSSVTNSGTITAPSGQVILAAGDTVTLSSTGTSSLSVATTGGGNVTDSGIISTENVDGTPGTIVLKAGMTSGTTTLASTAVLDASAPNGGNGGRIETSGYRVNVATGAVVTTEAPFGTTGTWLMDPASFYIGMNTGTANSTAGNVLNYEDISGATLGTDLGSSNVVIDSAQGAHGSLGNIYVNDAVNWSGTNSLTLNAVNNIELNKALTSTSGALTLRADNMDIVGGGAVADTGTFAVNSGGSLNIGGSVNVYYNPSGMNYASPTTYTNAGSGSLTPWMLVSNTTDLQNMNNNLSANYALNTNIGWSTNTTTNFTPIGESTAFSGTFDGLSHTITNLYESNSDTYAGLFGQVSSTGTVRNIGLITDNISSTGIPVGTGGTGGNATVGGLVGDNTGTINYSYVTGSLTGTGGTGGTGSAGNGGTGGNATVGGLVGDNTGTINYSYATGSVSGTGGTGGTGGGVAFGTGFNGGTGGNAIVGGLVGDNTGGPITNSYATGSVSGTGGTGGTGGQGGIGGNGGTGGNATGGGLVGGNNSISTVSYSYATGSASGTGGNGGNGGRGGLGNGGNGGIGGNDTMGGLVGDNTGTVNYSYATGNATGGGLAGNGGNGGGTNCGHTGNGGNNGNTIVGGLVGDNTGTINYSYWDSTVYSIGVASGSSTGATGLTTGQFGTSGNLLGWTSANNSGFNTWGTNSFSDPVTAYPWFMGTITTGGSQISAPILVGDLPSDTIKANNASMTYTGLAWTGTPSAIQSVTLGGTALPASSISYSGSYSTGANAGSYAIAPTATLMAPTSQSSLGGVTFVNGNLTIAPAMLSLSTTASKVYDGTASIGLTPTNTSVVGVVSTQTASLSSNTSGTLSSPNVGSNIGGTDSLSLSILTGNTAFSNAVSSGDYTFQTTFTGGAITPATLTASTTASKVYDGTASTTLSGTNTTFTGVDGQTATLNTSLLGSLDSANAGSNIGGSFSVTGSDLTGSSGFSSLNYTLPTTFTGGTIGKATLTATANSASTTYGASIPALSGTVTGFVTGQTLASDGGTAAFTTTATQGSSSGRYGVTWMSSGLSSPYAGDYTVLQTSGNSTALTIGKVDLTLSGYIRNPTMTYNGGTSVVLTPSDSGAVLSGFVSGQGASYTGATGTFISPNIGTRIGVTATLNTSDFSSFGPGFSWSNYRLPPVTLSGTGTIASSFVPPPLDSLFDLATRLPFTGAGSNMELSPTTSVYLSGPGTVDGLPFYPSPDLDGNLLEEKNSTK